MSRSVVQVHYRPPSLFFFGFNGPRLALLDSFLPLHLKRFTYCLVVLAIASSSILMGCNRTPEKRLEQFLQLNTECRTLGEKTYGGMKELFDGEDISHDYFYSPIQQACITVRYIYEKPSASDTEGRKQFIAFDTVKQEVLFEFVCDPPTFNQCDGEADFRMKVKDLRTSVVE